MSRIIPLQILALLAMPLVGCMGDEAAPAGVASNPVTINGCVFDGNVACPGFDLSETSLIAFDLTNADLAGADLTDADLRNAILNGAMPLW